MLLLFTSKKRESTFLGDPFEGVEFVKASSGCDGSWAVAEYPKNGIHYTLYNEIMEVVNRRGWGIRFMEEKEYKEGLKCKGFRSPLFQ